MTGKAYSPRALLLFLVIATYVAAFTSVALVGLRFDMKSVLVPTIWFGTMVALISAYCNWRSMEGPRGIAELMLLGLMVITPNLLCTYAAIKAGMPLADANLSAMDARLGFDWPEFILFVDRLPWLADSLNFAYASFAFQLFLLPPAVALLGHPERSYKMFSAYLLVCLAASLITVWYPAISAYPFYGLGVESLKNINPQFGYQFLEQFHAVRGDANFIFSLDYAEGIVTFPSIHAAGAILCAWAAWPVKSIRWPILALNVAMGVSALTHGSHYLIDVIAGASLGVASLVAVTWLTSYSRPRAVQRPAGAPGDLAY